MGNIFEKEFTVEDGIKVQTENLEKWKIILKEEYYLKLEEFAKKENHLAKNGFQIQRGSSLDDFVHNMPNKI